MESLTTVLAQNNLTKKITQAMGILISLVMQDGTDRRVTDNGLIEIDNNAAERALRTVAVGRKNYLFLGSDAGGERAATMYSLLGTVKLNGINPEKYLRHVLSIIADYPVNKVSELLPWNVTIPEDNCQLNKVEQ